MARMMPAVPSSDAREAGKRLDLVTGQGGLSDLV